MRHACAQRMPAYRLRARQYSHRAKTQSARTIGHADEISARPARVIRMPIMQVLDLSPAHSWAARAFARARRFDANMQRSQRSTERIHANRTDIARGLRHSSERARMDCAERSYAHSEAARSALDSLPRRSPNRRNPRMSCAACASLSYGRERFASRPAMRSLRRWIAVSIRRCDETARKRRTKRSATACASRIVRCLRPDSSEDAPPDFSLDSPKIHETDLERRTSRHS